MSWVMEYNIIAGGPVGAADVEAVFGRWGQVRPLDGGAVDVVIGDCGFVIAPEASSSVNPAFVRWVAHARGFGGSARVYSTEIDESYLESEGEETEVGRQVEAGLARLAERVGGVYAPFFQGDAIDYTDPVGGYYSFASGPIPSARKREPGSPALHLSWYGRPGLYTLSCTVPVSAFERDDRPCLDELREFVALAAEDLGAEVATCELLYGYDCGSGIARPTRKASAKRVVVVDEAGRLLGLPAVTPWWVWLGPAYSGLLTEWIEARSKWWSFIKYPGFRGILISTNGKAWRYERPNRYDWIPKEYMIRKRRFSKAWEPAPRIPHWDGE